MEYFYSYTNSSVFPRVIEYLTQQHQLLLEYVTVVQIPDGWLIRIKLKRLLEPQLEANFLAVMSEFGQAYSPSIAMKLVLGKLSEGQRLTEVMHEVMHRYGIAIVTHDNLDNK